MANQNMKYNLTNKRNTVKQVQFSICQIGED